MRVTSRGIGLVLCSTALLTGGFGFGYPELAVLGTAAALAVAFALAYVMWRPRLAVRRGVDPDRVMRGETSQVTLQVRNSGRLRGATLIAYDRCGARSVPVPLLRLRAGRETTVRYPVPTHRRGIVEVGPLRVVRHDPLGLLSLGRTHGGVARVWVYPKVYPLSTVPVGVLRSLDGRVDRVPHGTITFDALREYVVGDELRHVHWRTTARVGELMVREHVDTSLPRLVVLIDDRSAAHDAVPGGALADGTSASFEAACEAAASIVMAALRDDLSVALRLISGAAVAPAHGHSRPYLDLLAEATTNASPALATKTSIALAANATTALATAAPGTAAPAAREPGSAGGPAGDPLDRAIARLRHERAGDTLIFLTGPGGREDIGRISTLRGAYPTIVASALGTAEDSASTLDGLVVLAATDGADFTRAWDGVSAWS